MNRNKQAMSARVTALRNWSGWAVAAGLGLAACTDAAPELREPELALLQQAIINGAVAPQADFDHTGVLVAINPSAQGVQVAPFCTATLIGPQVVVTAKHCVKNFPDLERRGVSIEWRAGPDALAPRASARIAMVHTAPGDVGGAVNFGRDVAVAVLDTPMDIAPVQPRAFPQDGLGVPYLTMGYGVFSPAGATDGQRRVGRETVRATSGRIAEALYGDFETFVELSLTGAVTEQDFLPNLDEAALATLRLEYDRNLLLDEHEAVGGGTPEGQRFCRGDSGGPLLRLSPSGQWVSYGVISAGPGSATSVCDFGSIYATFGPDTLEFVRASQGLEDPCGEVDERGLCEEGRVVRCVSNFSAGLRRLETEDCAALSLECVMGAEGPRCAGL